MAAGTELQEKELIAKSKRMLATTKDPIERIRLQCLTRGVSGIKRIGQIFRIMDDDNSRRISFEEFCKGSDDFGVELTDEERQEAFDGFDADDSGLISFDEFLVRLRPPMSHNRISIIEKAFNKFDKSNDGIVTVADVRGAYNAKHHPKFKNGEWTEEQVFGTFLKNFDSPTDPDLKVTKEEFINYYAGLSASFDTDMQFDYMMRNAWDL
uniref:calcyphosin-like protein n=1 Tax=Styela clava TaxID=7725 RepID=UPI00193A37A3|nr:calcyphosin-like protein [Styela clava]